METFELLFRPMYDRWEVRQDGVCVKEIANSLYARKEAEEWMRSAELTKLKTA